MSNTFLSIDKNDEFSALRGLDLKELLVETESFFLEYRDTLNLPEDLTFGVEIEYEWALKLMIDKFIKKHLNEWISKCDITLFLGGEITSPIMSDDIKYWQELKMICHYLTNRQVDTLHNAGGHIHIGANVILDDIKAWRHFIKLYIAYENVLFRFTYGDKLSAREIMYTYAPPIADRLYEKLDLINRARRIDDIKSALRYCNRQVAVSFQYVDFFRPSNISKNTIEFRSPNATTNEVIWQNNINAFAKMLLAARDKVMDEEFLDYKLSHEFYPYFGNEYLYNNVNLKNVLEFVDLVFDNNLDKIYFLRQYLKNFQDNYGVKKAVLARRFVK